MAQRMDGEISAFEFSVIKDCFRRMVSEGLPEHEWVAAVENPLAALTGLNKADPELIAGMYPWRKAEELKRRLIDRDRLDRADRASRQILHFKRGQDHPIEGTEGRFSGIAFGWHAYCSEVRSSQKEVAALTIPNCQSYGTSRPRRHSLAALAPFSALRKTLPAGQTGGFFCGTGIPRSWSGPRPLSNGAGRLQLEIVSAGMRSGRGFVYQMATLCKGGFERDKCLKRTARSRSTSMERYVRTSATGPSCPVQATRDSTALAT